VPSEDGNGIKLRSARREVVMVLCGACSRRLSAERLRGWILALGMIGERTVDTEQPAGMG
jgi:hypothetical protein